MFLLLWCKVLENVESRWIYDPPKWIGFSNYFISSVVISTVVVGFLFIVSTSIRLPIKELIPQNLFQGDGDLVVIFSISSDYIITMQSWMFGLETKPSKYRLQVRFAYNLFYHQMQQCFGEYFTEQTQKTGISTNTKPKNEKNDKTQSRRNEIVKRVGYKYQVTFERSEWRWNYMKTA